MGPSRRRAGIVLAVFVAVAVAVPAVIAADPSSSPEASASTAPASGSPEASSPETASPEATPTTAPTASSAPTATAAPRATAQPGPTARPEETGKPDKEKDKEEGPPITVTGKVGESANGKGWKTYTLTAGSKTYELSAGPPWFWGDKNPLAAYVGKTVEVTGRLEDTTEIDVQAVDGKAIREPGKPPWAGGPWVVGERHPGWKPWMTGGKPGHGHGRDGAPGQLKDKSGGDDSSGDSTGSSGLR